MATHAQTGTFAFSGVTTTTEEDILTLTGWNTTKGGRIAYVMVTNRHASAILYVRTDATTLTAAAGDGVTVIKAGLTAEVPVEPAGMGNGTVTVRLIGSAACDYNVVARRA